jgi:hypothetical protein
MELTHLTLVTPTCMQEMARIVCNTLISAGEIVLISMLRTLNELSDTHLYFSLI